MDLPLDIRQAAPDELDLVVAIDDDACTLYTDAGLGLDIGPDHPFTIAERADWQRSLTAGLGFFAEKPGAGPVGLAMLDYIDGAHYLEQLSVRRAHMRQGIGRRLLQHTFAWSAGHEIWLTTYGHLPWNRPIYERMGFAVVPEADCPPGMVTILEHQRRWLPAPAERVAMRRRPSELPAAAST